MQAPFMFANFFRALTCTTHLRSLYTALWPRGRTGNSQHGETCQSAAIRREHARPAVSRPPPLYMPITPGDTRETALLSPAPDTPRATLISPSSSISGDVWTAHIALDGTQYVRSRKAITIRFRENCPIPNDTTGEYRENLYRSLSVAGYGYDQARRGER